MTKSRQTLCKDPVPLMCCNDILHGLMMVSIRFCNQQYEHESGSRNPWPHEICSADQIGLGNGFVGRRKLDGVLIRDSTAGQRAVQM